MATNTQVLVVGAGPAGLFMAAELNRHGVSCRIVDKNDGPTHDSRAASIQARTLEMLDSVSLADEFVQVGNICHAAATYTSDHKLIKYLTFDELDSELRSLTNGLPLSGSMRPQKKTPAMNSREQLDHYRRNKNGGEAFRPAFAALLGKPRLSW